MFLSIDLTCFLDCVGVVVVEAVASPVPTVPTYCGWDDVYVDTDFIRSSKFVFYD